MLILYRCVNVKQTIHQNKKMLFIIGLTENLFYLHLVGYVKLRGHLSCKY